VRRRRNSRRAVNENPGDSHRQLPDRRRRGFDAGRGPAGTAFPWRTQSAVAQWYVETSGQTSTAAQWVSAAHQVVQPFSVGGYVNYLEANTSAARYFGANLSRLTSVRQKYDPNKVMFSGLDF
jgi:hypothetical protein